MCRRFFTLSLLLLLADSCFSLLAQQGAGPTIEKEIVYCKVDGKELHLDLVKPTGGIKPFPFLIWLHGGGWRQGDRKDYHKAMLDLARLGYAGASVEYRLAPAHKFPTQLNDIRAALAFLRQNAGKYELDANRIAVTGGSAGGHLSLMLGLAPGITERTSSCIRAIVDVSGPTDFRSWTIGKEADDLLHKSVGVDLNGLLADFIGTSDRQDRRMLEVSPITYVRKESPPVLILHGTGDSWVPFQQAQALRDAMQKAGAPVKLVAFEGASHFADFWSPEQRAKSKQELEEFLEKYLRSK
jgi:acetyl esterase/lipase